MTDANLEILIILLILVVDSIFAWIFVEAFYKLEDKSFENLNNKVKRLHPDFYKAINHYNELKLEVNNYRCEVLYEISEREESARKKLPYSTPEEKVELIKTINKIKAEKEDAENNSPEHNKDIGRLYNFVMNYLEVYPEKYLRKWMRRNFYSNWFYDDEGNRLSYD